MSKELLYKRGFTQVSNILLLSPYLSPDEKVAYAILASYPFTASGRSCFSVWMKTQKNGREVQEKSLRRTWNRLLKSLQNKGLIASETRGKYYTSTTLETLWAIRTHPEYFEEADIAAWKRRLHNDYQKADATPQSHECDTTVASGGGDEGHEALLQKPSAQDETTPNIYNTSLIESNSKELDSINGGVESTQEKLKRERKAKATVQTEPRTLDELPAYYKRVISDEEFEALSPVQQNTALLVTLLNYGGRTQAPQKESEFISTWRFVNQKVNGTTGKSVKAYYNLLYALKETSTLTTVGKLTPRLLVGAIEAQRKSYAAWLASKGKTPVVWTIIGKNHDSIKRMLADYLNSQAALDTTSAKTLDGFNLKDYSEPARVIHKQFMDYFALLYPNKLEKIRAGIEAVTYEYFAAWAVKRINDHSALPTNGSLQNLRVCAIYLQHFWPHLLDEIQPTVRRVLLPQLEGDKNE